MVKLPPQLKFKFKSSLLYYRNNSTQNPLPNFIESFRCVSYIPTCIEIMSLSSAPVSPETFLVQVSYVVVVGVFDKPAVY